MNELTYEQRRILDALRSGEYRQGRDRLRTQTDSGNYYCCLGVMCDVLDVGEWQMSEDDEDGHWFFRFRDEYAYNIHQSLDKDAFSLYNESDLGLLLDGTINQDVARSIGLSGADESALMRANDSGDWTFENIADLLEKHWSESVSIEEAVFAHHSEVRNDILGSG